ncbi:TRAP transporter small permease [Rhodovibrionaceae bacterium A322]
MIFFKTWFLRITEGVAAAMLAAMFITFLLQIFSRYVLQTPFGWTLEFCLMLWVWIVFFGNAFVVRHVDHVTFDVFYWAVPKGGRRVLVIITAVAIAVGMLWSFLPTWDYIDWMKIRKTSTVENPFTGKKIPLRDVFSIYALFLLVVALRYLWMVVDTFRNGPPSPELETLGDSE